MKVYLNLACGISAAGMPLPASMAQRAFVHPGIPVIGAGFGRNYLSRLRRQAG